MERSIKRNGTFCPLPLEQIQPILLNRDRAVLLETQRFDRDNFLSYLFFEPAAVITCFDLGGIRPAFSKLEAFLDNGFWAAGFFSYETGYAWEKFKARPKSSFPLIWLGIFNPPLIFDHRQARFLGRLLDSLPSRQPHHLLRYQIKDIRLNEKLPEYVGNIRQIKDYIARGLTYQVNYTLKCKFKFRGESLALYKNLRDTQPVAYAAFIKDRQFNLLSFSPELFFRKQDRMITVRPMKGTISRGRTQKEDRLQARRLKASHKDQSENVMIVDLLRNDLGRICETGSVDTLKLYTVEKYKTLLQMTSTIQARLKDRISVYDLFRSIFPSGSVTGAPKIRTMEIIRELEGEERRVYTGAIGFFKPNRDAVFNVAIRTLLLEGRLGEMGIGSGIVYDSSPQKEYKECKLKAMFFTHKRKEFRLIETMRWSKKEDFRLLAYHLDRLKSSAQYFNFSFDPEGIRQELKRLSQSFDPAFAYRVRLLLSCGGDIRLSYRRIKMIKERYAPRIIFGRRATDSRDVFLYHKTTHRRFYDREYRQAKRAGLFEVIFENERDEITEGAVSNIFIRRGGVYYTPPVSCGLLNGVYRQYLMERKPVLIREKVLRRVDLYNADAIYLTNAVRGMTRARLSYKNKE